MGCCLGKEAAHNNPSRRYSVGNRSPENKPTVPWEEVCEEVHERKALKYQPVVQGYKVAPCGDRMQRPPMQLIMAMTKGARNRKLGGSTYHQTEDSPQDV